MANEKSKEKSKAESVLKTARKRFQLASEAESALRKEALDDLKFIAGDQWPIEVKNQRNADGRPCLTINRLPQFVRQVTNDQRQNRPSIKVSPVDDGATVETAKVLQGLIRHIEYDSNAEIAYDTASDAQCRNGFGYFRIITEFCDAMSFDQDIKIKPIKNPFSVFMDPSYQEPDGSDAEYCQIVVDLSKDKFKSRYPNAKLSHMEDWKSLGDQSEGWVYKDGCRLAEYYEKVYEEIDVVLLSDGSVVKKSDLPDQLPEGVEIKDERKAQEPTIKWRIHNGIEILEETEWPGKYIPVVPVLGDEIIVNGEKILESVIRHAKDSQRMLNYWASAETEAIALAPKTPYIGYEGQFDGFEDQWKTANVKNHAFLQVRATTIAGQPAPLPQRNVAEAPVQAITQARMQAADDLKATTGIYDASLGNRSNEQSGVAIQGRVRQAEVSNFHMVDNFTRSLRHAGRILIEIIPKIYDTPRAIRIIHEDGEQEQVIINQLFQQNGKSTSYDLSAGTYDVTVSTGPSYQTKRQEAVASMMQLTQAMPQVMQSASDLLVKNMDWPGAQEISERLKKLLPPQLQDSKDGEEPIPAQAQQQITQMRQMIQQLTQQLHHTTDIIQTKKIELESKERIELAKLENDLIITQMKTDASHAQTAFQLEIESLHKRLDLVGQQIPIGSDTGAAPQSATPPDQTQNQQPIGGTSPSNAPQAPSMGV